MLPYASQDGVKSMKCDGQKMKIWLLYAFVWKYVIKHSELETHRLS